MKKLILLIILTIFLTGCDSYIELNDLVVINAIGIEKDNELYKIYISLVETKNKENITKIIEDKGSSINQILDNLSLTLNKKIYLSHLELLVVNNTIKDKEWQEIVNFFLNNNETREDYLVAYSNDLKKALETKEFNYINELIENNFHETSKTIKTSMFDVIKNLYDKEKIYLPYLEVLENLKLNGLKVYEDNTWKDIKEDKVIYLNYYLNNIKTYKYSYKCQGDDNKFLYLEILKAYSKNIKNKLLITNEIKVINNDCNLTNTEINKIFKDNLTTNLKEFTNKQIEIKNIIRGFYEN